jgi:hypothetical protein
MADELVTIEYGSVFHNFESRIRALQANIVTEGGNILREEEEQSIRLRWYDKGETLRSLQEEVIIEGDTKIYRLFPTATSKRGFPYPLAGEYGTGREGARTGRPAPSGWVYGQSKGMRARRYSRIAVAQARPRVVAKAGELMRNFTVS